MLDWLTSRDIAHRGLFERGTEREENTLAAILSAVEAGYACEFDVRITGDDEVVVFHDATLERLTAARGTVGEMAYRDLAALPVGNGTLPMPLLREVLEAVNGRQTLVIELKTEAATDIEVFGEACNSVLATYKGPFAVMSFDPRIIKWFWLNAPRITRGMVLEVMAGEDEATATRRHHGYCETSGAQFVSHDIKTLPTNFTEAWRAEGKPLLCWTVRTREQEEKGRKYTDALTFEPPAVTGN